MKVNKLDISFFLITILIAIVVGNRGDTRDTQIYLDIFRNIESFDLLDIQGFYDYTGVEIGYGWLSYLYSLFFDSHVLLFTLISFLSFYFLYKTVLELEFDYKDSLIALFLYLSSSYFFMQQFMQMRQGLSVPLAYFCLMYLLRNNRSYIIFALLALLSFSFHQINIPIVLAGLSFIFLLNYMTRLTVLQFKIFLILVTVVLYFLLKFFAVEFLLGVSGRVSNYYDSGFAEELDPFRLINIKALLILLMLLYLIDKEFLTNKKYILLALLYAVGVSSKFAFIDFAILSGRFSNAFSYVEIFIIPLMLNRFSNVIKYTALFIYFIVSMYLTYIVQAPYILEDYFIPLPG